MAVWIKGRFSTKWTTRWVSSTNRHGAIGTSLSKLCGNTLRQVSPLGVQRKQMLWDIAECFFWEQLCTSAAAATPGDVCTVVGFLVQCEFVTLWQMQPQSSSTCLLRLLCWAQTCLLLGILQYQDHKDHEMLQKESSAFYRGQHKQQPVTITWIEVTLGNHFWKQGW